MSDDMLSQDEINELLKGLHDDDDETAAASLVEEKEANLVDYLTEFEQDALGEIGNISFGSAATALSQLLNQKVEITTPSVSLILKDDLEKEFPQPHVAVHVEYTEGFEGINILVIKTQDAAVIADLMLGGDGSQPSEELTDMHISAVQEAMNQMMGSASTSMSTIFNKKVDISPPGINLIDFKTKEGTENVPEDNYLVKISFRLTIGDLIDSNIMQLVTIPFAKELVEELMNPEGKKEAEPKGAQVQQTEQQIPTPPPPKKEVAARTAPPPPQTNQHIGGFGGEGGSREVHVQPAEFSSFDPPQLSEQETNNLNMLLDIPLQVTVELGRTTRSIKEILEYTQGSIIELDKLAGEHIDILVNQKLIAKGEVVVIDENFGVRITDIISQEDRIRNLK